MAVSVVVGAQWGDEAKGKVVDFLAEHADFVIRYNGGNNAGHTVVLNGRTFKFHLIPCGILHSRVTCIIADGEVLDPRVLVQELNNLKERGISPERLLISANAHVIMPYHLRIDALEEQRRGCRAIGTTSRGIGPVYADKAARIGIRMCEFVDPNRFRERLSENLEFKNVLLAKVYGAETLSEKDILEEYLPYADQIRPFVANTSYVVHEAAKLGKNLLFEGAQGTLLDIDHGTYPYVTSSHAVAGGACLGTGIGPLAVDRAIGVAKAYTTRVGAGVFPTELFDEIGDYIRERGKEYGTTTGRPRRCGWLDAVALRYSVMVNSLTEIALTLLDVLGGLDTVKICRAYRWNGEETTQLSTDWQIIENLDPVYEELPGWPESTCEARRFEDLPSNAQAYVHRVEELVGTPISLISVGADRYATIVR